MTNTDPRNQAMIETTIKKLKHRIDQYGSVDRSKEKTGILFKVEGNFSSVFPSPSDFVYQSPNISFISFYIGVEMEDFPYLIIYKLGNKKVLNNYKITEIKLAEINLE